MALQLTCDYCGEPVPENWLRNGAVELTALGSGVLYHAHYHRECWEPVEDRLSMIHEVSADLHDLT